MAENKFANLSGGIGDIGDILHNQGVSDLSWLAVDEDAYRAAEALPKQNLDIIPELQKALYREGDEEVPHLIPMKPHVMVNRNPLDKPSPVVDFSVPIKNRVARLVLEGKSPADIRDRVLLEFSEDDVRRSASTISQIMGERGVLGTVYVDSSHFSDCDQLSGEDKRVVTACSKRSLYLLSKPECSGCVHNQSGRCASMKMRLVESVTYGPQLAQDLSPRLASEYRTLSAPVDDSEDSWKEAIKTAFLTPVDFKNPDGVRTVHTQQPRLSTPVTSEDVKEFLSRTPSQGAVGLSSGYTKYAKRMMDGHDDRQMLIASGDPELVQLATEYGLLGHTWIDMDALGSCKAASAYLDRHGSGVAPDYFVRRSSSCPHCRDASDGACCRIAGVSKIVKSVPAYDRRVFASSLLRAVRKGTVPESHATNAVRTASESSDWKSLTAQANLFRPVESRVATYSGIKFSTFAGDQSTQVKEMDPEEIRRTVSSIMNQGYSGNALQEMLLNRYSREDLASFPEIGHRFASEDGIQGTYYVDPTAYTDYGHGCNEGATKFRKRGAPNILASGRCTGCVLQTHPGWCSKYAKTMIRSVPESVRTSAKRSLPVIQQAPISNPVDQYQLATALTVDQPAPRRSLVDITIGERTIEK